MVSEISVEEYIADLKVHVENSLGIKKNPFAVQDRKFADGFVLTQQAIDELGLREMHSLPKLVFENMSGTVIFRDISCIGNLSFTKEGSFSESKQLTISLENVQADTISILGLQYGKGAVALAFRNVVAKKIFVIDSIINRPNISSVFSVSDSVIEKIHVSYTDMVYLENHNKSLVIMLSNSVLGEVELDGVKAVSNKQTDGGGKVIVENCFIEKELKIQSSPRLGDLLLLKTALNLDPWWKNQQAVSHDSLFINLGTGRKLELSKTSLNELKISNYSLKELVSTKSEMGTLVIKERSAVERFALDGYESSVQGKANVGTLHFDNATIDVLSINGNGHAAVGNLKFTNALIKKGLIKENSTTSICMEDLLMGESFLQINDTTVKEKLIFSNFNNLGVIHFINLKARETDQDPLLELKNSTLGKMHFYGCSFNEYLEYDSSSITDITVLSTEFPWRLEEVKKDEATYKKQKSLLGQLRRVYEQNNDVSNAMQCNARQLDIIRRALPFGWERFALWLNWGTNFYGNDLRRAFWVTFIGCVLLYLLYGAARGYIVFGSFEPEYFWYMATNFLEFLSPVRRINLLKPFGEYGNSEWNPATEKVDDLTVLVSGISRIIVSYLLVQFILAFRKYGRKA